MSKKIILKKISITILVVSLFIVLGLVSVFKFVDYTGSKQIYNKKDVKNADAVIILGAYVFPSGKVSDMLKDRLDVGAELYFEKKAPKIIVSGDHGRVNYDEVNNMRKYLQAKGIKREDIFMDHAGFDTYDSIYRARDIFLIKSAIIVTQEFHLKRALYIAGKLGIDACGVVSDNHVYPGMKYYNIREVGARFKAFLQAGVFQPKPKYLGSVIPVSGSGVMTDDGK